MVREVLFYGKDVKDLVLASAKEEQWPEAIHDERLDEIKQRYRQVKEESEVATQRVDEIEQSVIVEEADHSQE